METDSAFTFLFRSDLLSEVVRSTWQDRPPPQVVLHSLLILRRRPTFDVWLSGIADVTFAFYSSISVVFTKSHVISDKSFVRKAAAVDYKEKIWSMEARRIEALCVSSMAASVPIRTSCENSKIWGDGWYHRRLEKFPDPFSFEKRPECI